MPSAKSTSGSSAPIPPGIRAERNVSATRQQNYQRGFGGDTTGHSRPYDNVTLGSIRADDSVSDEKLPFCSATIYTTTAQHPGDASYSSNGALDYQRQSANPYASDSADEAGRLHRHSQTVRSRRRQVGYG